MTANFTMAATNMATTKIDRDSLAKLRMLADREKRNPSAQLAILIDTAFRVNPAELTDQEFLGGVMDSLVEKAKPELPQRPRFNARINAPSLAASAGERRWQDYWCIGR